MSKNDYLQRVNEILNIKKTDNRKLVFVYTQPKVGSTSIVSSLRLYAIDKIQVIHVHDETMLKMLGNIQNVSIQDIIDYNKIQLQKDVYVINVYRSPIERKISAFFEKIGSFHFNNTDENIDTNPNYTINRIITRFNNIFTHIANGDHYLDLYINNISNNIFNNDKNKFCFNHTNNYILDSDRNGVKYITLRLKDASTHWNDILSTMFDTQIKVIPDYESKNKAFAKLYKEFKNVYQIPSNYLQDIQLNDKYFLYYYSPKEQEEYIQTWSKKLTSNWEGYTKEQYKLYKDISTENAILDIVKGDHYLDEGCLCNNCNYKRKIAIKHFEQSNMIIKIKHEDTIPLDILAKQHISKNKNIRSKHSYKKVMKLL
jgi:hypothetical protein